METKTLRFFELTGDDKHSFDEVNYKEKCPYIGNMDNCMQHKKPLSEFEGWRMCCAGCTIPIQTKTDRMKLNYPPTKQQPLKRSTT